MSVGRRAWTLEELEAGVRAGRREVLSRAITLVESARADHRRLARRLLEGLLPETGRAHRIGITGPPGVGKSTFIEALGLHLVERGIRVAVVAVDPSSSRTGGSILGDKTRMERLSRHPGCYIRPSPGGGGAGGVARRSREVVLLCEAAGFEVILVETLGVGQAETAVAEMVDSFVLLLMPGSGDELQGVKRGVMERVDLAVVTKADGPQRQLALRARRQCEGALRLLPPATEGWRPPVMACSSITGEGIAEVWGGLVQHRDHLSEGGRLEDRRAAQGQHWFELALREELWRRFLDQPGMSSRVEEVALRIRLGRCTPEAGAEALLDPDGA